jgi:hypothetical protein
MPSHQNKPKKHRSKLTYLAISLLWLICLVGLLFYRQDITDWWRLRTYHPPMAISGIAVQDTMTDLGRKVFYVNSPSVIGRNLFNEECPSSGAEQTIILGCYHPGQNGIFLYDVSDQRLDGVEQVTAAHEMLHAAYERLSSKEKSTVNAELEDFYANGLHDERILKTIDLYKQTEPDQLVNEMHSVFGTEVMNLPAPLEAHYKKYFADRGQIVSLADKYQSEFTSRQQAVEQYDLQLSTLRGKISALEAGLKTRQANISQQQKQLQEDKSNGNITAYNAGVPGYNSQIETYNSEVQQVKALIVQYNSIVATRNSIALEEDQLVKDLNSKAQTINN